MTDYASPGHIPVGAYLLYLTDSKSRETRLIAAEDDWDDEAGVTKFCWIDGNFCCDCNRGDFFERASGDDDPDNECGGDRYVLRVEKAGVVVYDESR